MPSNWRSNASPRTNGAGVPAKIVWERLGHKGIAITLDLYSHVLPAMDQEPANRVAGMFDG
jgi:hypothetical protein